MKFFVKIFVVSVAILLISSCKTSYHCQKCTEKTEIIIRDTVTVSVPVTIKGKDTTLYVDVPCPPTKVETPKTNFQERQETKREKNRLQAEIKKMKIEYDFKADSLETEIKELKLELSSKDKQLKINNNTDLAKAKVEKGNDGFWLNLYKNFWNYIIVFICGFVFAKTYKFIIKIFI